MSINVSITNKIRITNFPDNHKKQFKKALTLPNPLYFKIQKSASIPDTALYAIDPYFQFFTERHGVFCIPRGMRERLFSYATKTNLDIDDTVSFVDIPHVWPEPSVVLRDYQKEIVDNITQKFSKSSVGGEGLLIMSTGSGKTITALELARRIGKTTTIIVNRTNLLDQFAHEAEQFFNVKASKVGGGSKSIGPITIATIQTLQKDKVLRAELAEKTSVLIVDEAHMAVTDKCIAVIESFSPLYLFGMTATPMREDGKAEAIEFYFGNKLAQFKMKQMKPKVIVQPTKERILESDNYHEMVEDMVHNRSRNTLIMATALGHLIEGRKVLILTKRIVHAEMLDEMFGGKRDGIIRIDSKDPGRNKLLADLKSGKQDFGILIGTTSLLSVGTDVPSLDVLILACEMRAESLLVQSSGRVLRLFEGKPQPIIVDMMERHQDNAFFYNQYKTRKKIYLENDWEVCEPW